MAKIVDFTININMTQYCALPECGKEFSNWRVSCCCKSHQTKYAGRMRHGSAEAKSGNTTKERKSHWSQYIVNRRKLRDKSMPAWANKNAMAEFYILARQLTEDTGIKHEVDHIIPSNHKLVCGLHNEFNLQVLTKVENIYKSNKFEI